LHCQGFYCLCRACIFPFSCIYIIELFQLSVAQVSWKHQDNRRSTSKYYNSRTRCSVSSINIFPCFCLYFCILIFWLHVGFIEKQGSYFSIYVLYLHQSPCVSMTMTSSLSSYKHVEFYMSTIKCWYVAYVQIIK